MQNQNNESIHIKRVKSQNNFNSIVTGKNAPRKKTLSSKDRSQNKRTRKSQNK